MNLYTIIRHAHAGFRFLVLALILCAVLQAIGNYLGKKPYKESHRKWNLFTMIAMHTQVLLGLLLYYLSPFVQFNKMALKISSIRYWTVEHAVFMLLAMALIAKGYRGAKKVSNSYLSHRTIAIFYALSLLVITIAILQSDREFFGYLKVKILN